jgi:hypothetical protein
MYFFTNAVFVVIRDAARPSNSAEAFGAHRVFEMPMPDGKIAHARSDRRLMIMISDETWRDRRRKRSTVRRWALSIHAGRGCDVQAGNRIRCDRKRCQSLISSGAAVQQDGNPFGHQWNITLHEDLTPEMHGERERESNGC